MNEPSAATSDAQAKFEALRQRWLQAKASGTTHEFAQAMLDESTPAPPPPERVYASEQERLGYELARAEPVTAEHVLELLRMMFGDVPTISMDQVLDELGISDDRTAGRGA